MKVTYNWLKEFLEIKITARALAEKLTMAGLEVTSLEEREGDFVFEIEVTSNRPDWLSVNGIAREIAAITGTKFKVQSSKFKVHSSQVKTRGAGQLKIIVQDKKDCPLYSARIIRDVRVGPSADWLKKRLELVGCRSVNNVVDITNYALLAWGEPLHAFDLDKLDPGIIIVRRAKEGEKIITIDLEERKLSPEVLVIADRQRAVAIAGVMGGRECEVNEGTKNILLEAAVFNPLVVRRARQGLGLASESSYRFERGVDKEKVEEVSLKTAALIEETCGGRSVLAKSAGSAENKKKNIALAASTANRVLGTNIPGAKIKRILSGLEFKVRGKAGNNFSVGVPSWRQDVSEGIDLIEEVARIYGYGLIKQTLPSAQPKLIPGGKRALVGLTRNTLCGLGLNEVITYSLIDNDLLRSFELPEPLEAVEIQNPLSKEQEILRPSLIPSLASCVKRNLNQKQEYIAIFEVANVFFKDSGLAREELTLGLAICGRKSYILEQGVAKEEAGFLHLKGALEVLLERLGIKEYSFNIRDNSSLVEVCVLREKIGALVRLGKNALKELDIKNKEVFAAEINLDKVFSLSRPEKKFVPLPKYPGIERDISFTLKEDRAVREILAQIKEHGGELLDSVKISDYYKGKQIPAGYQGLTVSCTYRSEARTLTEAEIAPLHSAICGLLTERFGAKMR